MVSWCTLFTPKKKCKKKIVSQNKKFVCVTKKMDDNQINESVIELLSPHFPKDIQKMILGHSCSSCSVITCLGPGICKCGFESYSCETENCRYCLRCKKCNVQAKHTFAFMPSLKICNNCYEPSEENCKVRCGVLKERNGEKYYCTAIVDILGKKCRSCQKMQS